MYRRAFLVLLPLFLIGCQNQQDPRESFKVLIGATTIVEPGARPIGDSIVIIAGKKIHAVGERKDIPVPQNSDRTELDGKFLVPAPGSRIAAGENANLLIVDRAPTSAAAPASASDVGAKIVNGEWEKP